MTNSRRVFALLVVSLVLGTLWLAYGSGGLSQQAGAEQPSAGRDDAKTHLDRAAASIVAAAEQGVKSAQSDEEALERTDLSIEALRIIGLLGGSDTDARAVKLLDDVQSNASPAVAEVVVRMRLARQLQQWSRLSRAEREKTIDRFVSDVQKEGLTPGHADLVLRLADNLEMANQGELASRAINELLPAFRTAAEPSVQRRAPLMEGVVRRLDLVGKPLEIEGTLLDGSEFDWKSYRGKVVLVDFFANWCEVCRAEVPNILQNYRAYHDKGFEVVGVSLDEQRGLAEMYRKQTGFQFPTLFSQDPRAMDWKSPLALKFGITSLPRAILVDQDGNVVDTVARGQRLGQHLRDLLGPAGAPAEGARRVGDLDEEPAGGLESRSEVVPAAFEQEGKLQLSSEQSPAPAEPAN